MNNSEAVSRVINSLKLLNKDDHISRRFVLRTLKNIAKTYISQRLTERTIQFDYNIYTDINCIEFNRIEFIDCAIAQFNTCNIIMKSVKPLPELVYSRLGAAIKDVRTIDNMESILFIDALQFRRNRKRKYSIDTEIYIYLGTDNHLYIVDKEVYAVNATVITMNPEEADECSTCSDSKCKSGWDYEFIIPDKLVEPVFREATQIIASTYSAIIADNNPNGIDKQPTA